MASPRDASMTSPPSATHQAPEPKFGGFTRFEIELEFVQTLSNPHYISHLATLSAPASTTSDGSSTQATTSNAPPVPLLQHPPFIAYLSYLRYFSTPKYVRYLMYPGPTLKNLELLQSERFRRDILDQGVVEVLVREGVAASERWAGKGIEG